MTIEQIDKRIATWSNLLSSIDRFRSTPHWEIEVESLRECIEIGHLARQKLAAETTA
jgi:hypothetical protein